MRAAGLPTAIKTFVGGGWRRHVGCQAMMAVMPFKHNNLRLLGLSNKILLADRIMPVMHGCHGILEGLIRTAGQ